MIPAKKINEIDQAFDDSKKRDFLNTLRPAGHEYKAFEILIIKGRIYNFEFKDFEPINCLSHTKVINRIKRKLEKYSGNTLTISDAKKDENKGNKNYWTIDKMEVV